MIIAEAISVISHLTDTQIKEIKGALPDDSAEIEGDVPVNVAPDVMGQMEETAGEAIAQIEEIQEKAV